MVLCWLNLIYRAYESLAKYIKHNTTSVIIHNLLNCKKKGLKIFMLFLPNSKIYKAKI